MIDKVRKKFILSTMLASLIVIFLVILGVSTTIYRNYTFQADTLLYYIAQNHGSFPEDINDDTLNNSQKRIITAETPFSTRYFTVTYKNDRAKVDISKISTVSKNQAKQYTDRVRRRNNTYGTYKYYRYLVYDISKTETMVIFLDFSISATTFYTLVRYAFLIGFFAFLGVSLLVLLLSKKAIRPMEKNFEMQKRFITDAGHELKTPLAIISANADVLELEHGKNEWVDSIRQQTAHLGKLIRNLLTLSRLDENGIRNSLQPVSLSSLLKEQVQSFLPLAKSRELKIEIEHLEEIVISANPDSMEMLFSILLENATKYSTEPKEPIRISMKRSGKYALICISNSYAPALTSEQLKHIFLRFYRTDVSRNSKSGGYGIGLSIAKSITEMHKGKIRAVMQSGDRIVFKIQLPV